MKRRRKYILWGLAALAVLVVARCHLILPPLREPDRVVQMKTTGYCAGPDCSGWKFNWLGLPVFSSGPNEGKFKIIGQTASGKMARPGTVAVDPDIFPMGTKFYIPGYGYGVAQDVGGAINGNHLDLFFRLHSNAEKWGVQQKKVKVWYSRNDSGASASLQKDSR